MMTLYPPSTLNRRDTVLVKVKKREGLPKTIKWTIPRKYKLNVGIVCIG